ncbi:unnamed protein product [Sphenostylis stenocarpa]|uniref:PWWP domain-containing protein n=1 Tax=Sphenostylis stenocarpa TaxID=92480 RepID=A0AA86S9P1_9FABA|nr:unnamed protein product [Sphenostylis stenocarpa]
MPPPRRRGANKAKANGHLRLGDLVLAKVKGFPYWPAMISRPEDWEKSPDPKKYFVQFFGTKEIAFVAPTDIQAFTNETKTKLSARCQGKTKYFTKAVKEICAAFDELEEQKASGLKEETDDSHFGSETPSVAGVVTHLKDATDAVVLNVEKTNTYGGVVGSNSEQCTQRCDESGSQGAKPSVSGRPIDSTSPVLSHVIESKPSIGAELNKHSSKSNVDEQSSLKVEGSDVEDVCNVNDLKQADNVQSISTNGSNSRKPVTGSRRSKTADDRKRSGEISRAFLKDESCAGYADLSRSGEKLKDRKKGKDSFSVKSDSVDALKLDSDINSGSKNKNLLKVKTSLKAKNELQEGSVCFEAERKKSFKQNKTQVHGKRNLGPNATSHATKKLKCMDDKDHKTPKSVSDDGNNGSPSFPGVDDKEFKQIELKRSTSRLKTEKGLQSRGQNSIVGSDDSVGELLPETKHHTQVQQAMPDSATVVSGEQTERNSLRLKGDTNNLTTKQVKRRRRAVCIFDDDDDDDDPKTPVHGGGAKDIKSPLVSEVVKNNDTLLENTDVAQLAIRKPSALEDSHFKEPTSELHDNLSAGHPQKEIDEVIPVHLPHSPGKFDSKQLPPKVVDKLSSISPVNSRHSFTTTKSNAEPHKSSKRMLQVSSTTQKKADNGSSKNLNSISSSPSQVTTHKKKPSVDTSKTTPKTLPQAVEVPVQTENLKEFDAFHVDGIEVGMEEKSSLYTVSRTPETPKTMKHLIAAAQAKRKQVAQAQCHHPHGIYYTQGGTPSPSTIQPFLSVSSNIDQADWQGVNEHPTLVSPSTNGYQSISQNQPDADENEEKRVSSAQRDVSGSLSGGTDAVVARDAFEGMIETLSRTKESIGRATRLAIDCAKYGIANEDTIDIRYISRHDNALICIVNYPKVLVVELLIRKLENETSFHRKVDLFFLVDSITQCSHNQKGGSIAGASYIPTVQGGLPRLLGAAAPPGASARENRRQCLKVNLMKLGQFSHYKVLRLWLERKIFPESVLRRYMDDIGVSNDDMTVSFSFRRPSRAERSLDDPIREMEGMLVDEYGRLEAQQEAIVNAGSLKKENSTAQNGIYPFGIVPQEALQYSL